jgi:hypothetical protein
MTKILNIIITIFIAASCSNSSESTTSATLTIAQNELLRDTSKLQTERDTVKKAISKNIKTTIQANSFESAFGEIKDMLEDRQPKNLKKAVFAFENAWYEGSLSYTEFDNQIQTILGHMRSMIAQKGIGNYKTAGNWAAHSFLSKPVAENNMQPYVYDFQDFMGKKDYTKMFVSKLLNTKTGNCHSLPLLYKILTDDFGAESFLALAPNHLYIKHKDENRRWFNLELTNGNFSTDSWIISSSHIKTEAIQNKVYMAALTQTESIAMCMTDLAEEYIAKYGYAHNDNFVLKCLDLTLKHYPHYIVALSVKANVLTQQLLTEAKAKGYKNFQVVKEYPEFQPLKQEINDIYRRIDDLGYEEMPKEQYERWLKDMQTQSQKQISQN